MQKATFKSKLTGFIIACAFGLFLVYGTISSSDFPRGLFGPPGKNDSKWAQFDSLNQNIVWNYRGVWEDTATAACQTVWDYLDSLDAYDLYSILRKADYNYTKNDEDSIPYFVEYYSYGNYNQLQVEWNYTTALAKLEDDGTGYYHFDWQAGAVRSEAVPGAIGAAVLKEADTTSGVQRFLKGIYLTTDGEEVQHINQEPLFDKYEGDTPMFGYEEHGRTFRHRFRVAIDTPDTTLDDTVIVMTYKMSLQEYTEVSYEKQVTKGDFGTANRTWKEFWVEGIATEDYDATHFSFFTTNKVDVYIDWVEYMDMEQGYPLWWDNTIAATTLQQIADQCEAIMDSANGDHISGWAQSDEPHRCFFESHGKINDFFNGHATLDGVWPQTPQYVTWDKRRADHFAKSGRPHIFNINHYSFSDTNENIGMQIELDSLASVLEWVYQTCGDTIPMYFTGQVHGSEKARDPKRSEIFAETFIALAHGAKGIVFYKYPSWYKDGEYKSTGLVDRFYNHNTEPWAEKWQAVHDVFAYLDSVGETLEDLDRKAAFCVAYEDGFWASGSVTDVEFTDNAGDTIEVGQFTDSSNDEYLILVNRHTDADLHINVETDLNGANVLRDIYTQEQFLSSTGNFKGIPFDSGEGRVFRIEESFSDWDWSSTDKFVLADTMYKVGTPQALSIAENCTVRATEYGMMIFKGTGAILDCNGSEGDSVVFTALESDVGWKGLYFDRTYGPSTTDTLEYTKVEYVKHPQAGLTLRDDSNLIIKHSAIVNNGHGIDCNASNIEMDYVDVNDNTGSGLWIANSDAEIYECKFNGQNTGLFAFNGSSPEIGYSDFIDNDEEGVSCYGNGSDPILLNSDAAYLYCGFNNIQLNGENGIWVSDDAYPWLGRSANFPGDNSIHDNEDYDVYNGTTETIEAQYNWWGVCPPAASQIYGLVDTTNSLSASQTDGMRSGPSTGGSGEQGGYVLDGSGSGLSNQVPAEALRLKDVAIDSLLNGAYDSAIDTFQLILNDYPGMSPAHFALNKIVYCYRKLDEQENLMNFLNDFILEPADTSLIDLAYYHKILNLPRSGNYASAISLASNPLVTSSMAQNLIEPIAFETGMCQKYGLENIASGDSVFRQFLIQYPQSPFAAIAAAELGITWDGFGTYSSGAEGVIQIDPGLPKVFALGQNYPNPFNPTTTINYELPEMADVSIKVYNIQGRHVVTLVDQKDEPGFKRIYWDGRNQYRRELASGLYILQMVAKGQSGKRFVRSQKMVLIK